MKKVNSVLSNLRAYCSMVQKNDRYRTSHEAHILGFGVPNAKNLAYGTPAMNALRGNTYTICTFILITLKKYETDTSHFHRVLKYF